MKKAIFLGIIQIPIQILLTIISQAYLLNNTPLHVVRWWYLLLSLAPIFSALEFAYPQIAISFFNNNPGSKSCFKFLRKSISIITVAQILFFLIYVFSYQGSNDDDLIFIALYFSSMYIRSICNIFVSVIYSLGGVVEEKTYKILYTCSFPLIFIVCSCLFTISKWLIIMSFFLSTMALFVFTLYKFFSSQKNKLNIIRTDSNCSLSMMNNLKLLLTTLPGVFIFNLSIYYLEFFSNRPESSTSVDVVSFGFFLQIFNIFNIINSIFTSVYLPRIARKFYQKESIENDIKNLLLINSSVAIVVVTSALFIGGQILSLIFHPQGVDFNRLMYFLVYVIAIESIQVTMTAISIGTGFYKFHIPSFLSALFVFLFSYFSVPTGGSEALIYSILLAQCLTCLPLNIFYSVRHLKISFEMVFYSLLSIISVVVLCMIVKSVISDGIQLLLIYGVFISVEIFFFKKYVFSQIKYMLKDS